MTAPLGFYSPIWGVALFALALGVVSLLGGRGPLALPRLDARARVGQIDGLRGVLAFAVFLTHAASTYRFRAEGVWAWPGAWFYAMCGFVPVSLFFMITGYLFWRRAIERKLRWRPFLVGRAYRILPLYLFALAVMLVFVAIESDWRLREPVADLLLGVAQWVVLVLERPDLNGSPTPGS